jgi:hypothetical protein
MPNPDVVDLNPAVQPVSESVSFCGNHVRAYCRFTSTGLLFACGQQCPGFVIIIVGMSGNSFRFDSLVGELRNQGLIVTVHSASNKTWYVKGDGIYVGYVVTEDELASLKRENRLDLRGVRSLG